MEDPDKGMLAPHPSGACSARGSNELEAPFKVRYVNANDRTVEGLDLIGKRAFTIQYHPENFALVHMTHLHYSIDSPAWWMTIWQEFQSLILGG